MCVAEMIIKFQKLGTTLSSFCSCAPTIIKPFCFEKAEKNWSYYVVDMFNQENQPTHCANQNWKAEYDLGTIQAGPGHIFDTKGMLNFAAISKPISQSYHTCSFYWWHLENFHCLCVNKNSSRSWFVGMGGTEIW